MWKEIIKIRTRIPNIKKAREVIDSFLNIQTLPPDLAGYQVYQSSTHQNEAMLEMDWDSPVPDRKGSRLANSLVFSMKKIGLVNLSIWHKMKETQ